MWKVKFFDLCVCEVLGLVFDFEWFNKNLFFDFYNWMNSYFDNFEFVVKGLLSEGELVFFEFYKD